MTRVLETDDNGALTIPADILEQPEPHVRYRVERNGARLNVEPVPHDNKRMPAQEWIAGWTQLANSIGESSTTDRSVVEILSEMRR